MDRIAWARVTEGVRAAGLPVLAIAFGVISITVPQHGRSLITSLTQLSPLLTLADVAAGLSLIAAGSIAWLFDRRMVGLASVLAGAAWFGLDWAASVSTPGPLRAAGLLAAAITLPLLAAVVVLGVRVGTERARTRPLLVAGAAIAILTIAWLVAWVPTLDPRCLAICGANPLGLGVDYGLARVLANAWQGLTLLFGVALASWSAHRLWRGSPQARRRDRSLLIGAIGVGLAWAVWAGTLLAPSSAVRSAGTVAALAFAGRAATATILAGGLVLRILHEQRTRSAVRRVAARMSPLPGGGTLRAVVASAFGDPGLQLVYALPTGGTLVDDAGRPVEPATDGRADARHTEIRAGDELVAVAIHAPREDGSPDPALGAAVLLAIDNERLLATVRYEMLALRESRARIVDAGDTARHDLERNLHDGAQQRMLGVLHELAMARCTAAEAGDRDAVARIDDGLRDAGAILAALRRLARGIHHSVLTESGLAAALEALADESPLPVEIDAPGDVRYPASTESAAWRIVTRLVRMAHDAAATAVRVRAIEADGSLHVTVEVDGIPAPLDTISLADRAGAAGGELETSWSAGHSMVVTADLPCA